MSADDKRLAIEQLQKGITQHRAGQMGLAQSHYQRAAKLDPGNPNPWHMLGVCALQNDLLPLAAKHFRACIKVSAGFAEAHNNLGVTLRRMGKHQESIHAFRNALKARERYVEAVYNLGLGNAAVGNLVEAERAYRQALQWRSADYNAANALANLLREAGRSEEAVQLYELARRLQPENAYANGALAQILLDVGRAREAVQYAQAAAAIEPERGHWWGVLGVAERLQRNTESAIAALRKAIALDPRDDVSLSELGVALLEAGELEEARDILARAQPNERHAERMRWTTLLSLPSVYPSEAAVDAERARYSQGLDAISAGLHLDTPAQRQYAFEAVGGVATFLLHYQPHDNTALQNRFGDLVDTVMRTALPNYMQPCAWRAGAHGGRLRIGIVSSHLMHHTVSRYFRVLLAGLDPARFDVRVYYSGEVRDVSTDYIAERVCEFHYLSEDALATAARLKGAQLDMLIYPETGMDPRHHVLGAMRLAPVQCVFYGHPATSGLPNMDYFLSGAALEPADAQKHYREKLVLLPGLGASPQRPPPPGDGAWVDAYAENSPLLLCLQNHLKLVPAFDDVLAQIVKRSGARLGFFVRNVSVGRRFRVRIEHAFQAQGLDPKRALVFLPSQSHELYLGAIARATLVLDSPWFSGGATSLDAFSVGAPVLAWEVAMARCRQTSGMLQIMGIDGLTARSQQDYIDKAIALIGDANARAALREQILQRNPILFENGDARVAFAEFIEQAVADAA
jgi:protein O-GlcNAc transferase